MYNSFFSQNNQYYDDYYTHNICSISLTANQRIVDCIITEQSLSTTDCHRKNVKLNK